MSQPIRFDRPPGAGWFVLFVALLAPCLPLASLSAQCTLVCNQNLTISLDNTGHATVTTQLLAPNAGSSCPGPLEVKLYTAQGVQLSNPLNCSQIGQTITATVRHLSTGNSCSGNLEVQDALSPVLSCPEKTVLCNQDASVAAVGLPTMTDNCTPTPLLDYQIFDTETDLGCSGTHAGYPVIRRIDRQWTVTDANGNSSSCIQKIWLRRTTAADVVFPPNHDGFALPALACGQDPNDLDLTGQPTVGGQPIDNGGVCELGIAHTDQLINYCPPAGYTVVRTWTLVEFCTSTITQRIQLIKVEDKTPPVVSPPANLTVGTYGNDCSATITLPNASATDNCSAVTITAIWEYGTGFGPFTGLALGSHVVTYTATDACGNSASTTALVTVIDHSPPTPICTAALQVALSSSGTAYVNASALDAGSFDQCGPVMLAVSRDEVTYTPGILVSCADLDGPFPVTLRITDAVGLENFCIVNLTVRDFLKPVLLCPADLTLNCLQDPQDLNLTGQAAASDNCSMQSLEKTDLVTLDGCHLGTVLRSWKATDIVGNTKVCTQHITLAPINTMSVVFPPNVTVNSCSTVAATGPAATGQPVISGQSCFAPSVTYTDQVFQVPPPACFRIVRTWEVIDFCIHGPNGGLAGYWQSAQIVEVRDLVAPELSIPADLTLSPDQPGCLAQVSLADVVATDCSATVTVTHNSAYAAPGVNASGHYPIGQHAVTFSASDNCGNITQKTLHITVQDLTPPIAECLNGLSVNLGANGQAALQASLLNGGSTDNCSALDELVFVAFPSIFTCQSIGYQQVILTVIDDAGNVSSCNTLVNVEDNNLVCGTFLHDIGGTIRTPIGQPLAEIPVRLAGDGLTQTVDCDNAGYFSFNEVPAGAYTLTP
ncbi:MAG: HYR domain-containing protein, partial [Saprospiraceae bacterium]